LGGERVRPVEGVLLLLLLTRIAHDDDCKVGRVELEKRRGVETSVRSEARAVASSSVGDVCALKFCCDNGIINYPSNKVPFSGKIGDSNGGHTGEKKTKKGTFFAFFKKSDLDFSRTFRDNFIVLYIFGSSFVQKEVIIVKGVFIISRLLLHSILIGFRKNDTLKLRGRRL